MRIRFLLLLVALLPAVALAQQPQKTPTDYLQLGREILREMIEIRSTEGGVGATPVAQAVARRLRAAGFAAMDVQVLGPSPKKHNVVARLRGSGTGRPIVLLGHIDVVEARREDWSSDLDPFKLIERDGYFYGRGTQDMKGAASILVANFIRWKREGWVPARDLILALTADEEAYGDEIGAGWLLRNHRALVDGEYVLNADGGDFQTKNGIPVAVGVSAGEKKETLIELSTENRGGHASIPRPDNAIYQLTEALDRIRRLTFPPDLGEVTRAMFAAQADLESGDLARDLRGASQVPPDAAAVERLSRDPYFNALMRTTCIPTQMDAGLGPSALPQFATAVINCRILPGQSSDAVYQTLRETIADSQVKSKWIFLEPGDSPSSPLNPEVFGAVKAMVQEMWPGVPIVPGLETGGTDSRFFRRAGIPAYGLSGLFLEQGDVRAHGRDERIRVRDYETGIDFYNRFMKKLAGK
ncbi:MAG TPA: M20/M25/M40 family metallo-hydrolase [Gemmatimonadales bacterium]|nr:M20/M25/M40 family metallo-hydrolase [Gemmatimonadales bacterium]